MAVELPSASASRMKAVRAGECGSSSGTPGGDFVRGGWQARQRHDEAAAAALARRIAYFAAVNARDLAHDGQAQARAGGPRSILTIHVPATIEGLEDLLLVFRRNAGPRVFDVDPCAIAAPADTNL